MIRLNRNSNRLIRGSAFACAPLAIMLALKPTSAAAQTNRSRTAPASPPISSGGGGHSNPPSPSSGGHTSSPVSSSSGNDSRPTSAGGDRSAEGPSSRPSAQRGKTDFGGLFPRGKSGAPTSYSKSTDLFPNQTDDGIFGSVMIPGQPAASHPSRKTDPGQAVPNRTQVTLGTSLDRYHQTQEAGYARVPSAPDVVQRIFVYSPYSYYDPFFSGYGYGFGNAYGYGCDPYGPSAGYPVPWDSRPQISYPDPLPNVYGGWPNYGVIPPVRDDSKRTYRNGEKQSKKSKSDLATALDAISRAFREDNAMLLAAYIRRDARIQLNLRAAGRSNVDAGDFLDRMAVLFRSRRTSAFTLDPAMTRDDRTFSVTGQHQYHDSQGMPYTTAVRFVLQLQNGALILTEFETE